MASIIFILISRFWMINDDTVSSLDILARISALVVIVTSTAPAALTVVSRGSDPYSAASPIIWPGPKLATKVSLPASST